MTTAMALLNFYSYAIQTPSRALSAHAFTDGHCSLQIEERCGAYASLDIHLTQESLGRLITHLQRMQAELAALETPTTEQAA